MVEFMYHENDTLVVHMLNPGLVDTSSHDRLFGQPTPAIVRRLRRIEMGRELDGRKVNSKKPLPGINIVRILTKDINQWLILQLIH